MATTFGIEEEFVMLDPVTLATADARGAVASLASSRDGVVTKEFFRSQIEHATHVCTDALEALDCLLAFRDRLSSWAREWGLVAAGAGTPLRIGHDSSLSEDERYARIAAQVAGIAPEHQINGLHVHVGIPDRDTGMRASNALRPWLPILLAMSANSPFWNGTDTGFHSWRAIHGRRWTTSGITPWFADASAYDDAVARLSGIGATSDLGTINWNIRLSNAYPTVEIRVFDAQLDAWSAVALAIIARILVEHARDRFDPTQFDVTDAALWHAARYGVSSTLVHPTEGELIPAVDALLLLQREVDPHLQTAFERTCVDGLFARLAAGSTGAAAQRLARSRGDAALADLYRRSLTRVPESASRSRQTNAVPAPPAVHRARIVAG